MNYDDMIRLWGYPGMPLGATPDQEPIPQPPMPVPAQPQPQPQPMPMAQMPMVQNQPQVQIQGQNRPMDFRALAAQQAMKMLNEPEQKQNSYMPLAMSLMTLGQHLSTPKALRGRNDNLQSMANNLLMWQLKNQAAQETNQAKKINALGMLEKLYQEDKPMVVGKALVNPKTGQPIYQSPEEFTLGEGQKRYQGNKVIAEGPEKQPSLHFGTPMMDSEGNAVMPTFNPKTGEMNQILMPGLTPQGQYKMSLGKMEPEQRQELINGLKSGDIVPSMLSKRGGQDYNALIADAHKEGVSLSKLQTQYDSARQFARTMNSQRFVNFYGYAGTITNTIDRLKTLTDEMNLSGFRPLNYVEIEGLMKTAGNTPEGQLATQYVTMVNGLKEEMAQVMNAGYAPTESVWKLVNEQINKNYGVKQMHSALEEVGRLIKYRVNAYKELNPYQLGGEQPPGWMENKPQQPQGQKQNQPEGNSLQISYQNALKRVQAMPEGPNKQAELQKLQKRAQELGL